MEDFYYTFINTTITRIGAILLITYGVQILINLYKYNLKISAFYEARADALIISETSDELIKVINSFSPDEIDFGKRIDTPTKELLEAAKSVLNSKTEKGG
ncbi:MAG: hypothetical protein R2750_12915 [Bacteroidales bacterium]